MDFLNTAEKRDRRLVHLPMGRFGEAVEIAKGALFREWSKERDPSIVLLIHPSRLRRQQLHNGYRLQDRWRIDIVLCHSNRRALTPPSFQPRLESRPERPHMLTVKKNGSIYTSFVHTKSLELKQRISRVKKQASCVLQLPFSNERCPLSFLFGILPESQFYLQLFNVIVEVLAGLPIKSELEEDFVVHEKRSKDEGCSEVMITFVLVSSRREERELYLRVSCQTEQAHGPRGRRVRRIEPASMKFGRIRRFSVHLAWKRTLLQSTESPPQ